jgi:hypothetical protein
MKFYIFIPHKVRDFLTEIKAVLTMWQEKQIVILSFAILIIFLLKTNDLHSQTTIIEYLQSESKDSEGVIHIESDTAITALLGTPGAGKTNRTETQTSITRTGYRIQVYMNNNPNEARAEALSRQSSIRSLFPEIVTYLTYEAPNWRLTAGDFLTREEASVFRQQLQKEFAWGKESVIITEKIKLTTDKNE